MRFPSVAPPLPRPLPETLHAPVPERYHGVWVRTFLETPEGRDTTTWVRWLQTSQWHADLRVPTGLDRRLLAHLAQQQGFSGITQIDPPQGDAPEICTWHRRCDIQPPRSTPDAGTMVFETPDRVIERGVHGNYLEVWERLPASVGRRRVLQRLGASGQMLNERLLITGNCLMHVRPRSALWPQGLQYNETLGDVIQRHPAHAAGLLDFAISYGEINAAGLCTLERSSLPALEGCQTDAVAQQIDSLTARIEQGLLAGDWRIIEWTLT